METSKELYLDLLSPEEQDDEVIDAYLEELSERFAGLETRINAKLAAVHSGLDGNIGDRGPKGDRGDRGDRGLNGFKGEKGDKGDDGKKGKDADIKDLEPDFNELKAELYRIVRQRHAGGNMNRNISIGNNGSALSPYTDINLLAGSNVTITYTPNNQTKNIDITFAATGGGGGTVRSINNISGDTTAGSTAGTDYVYLCTGTLTVTLPDAVANTNLYTVKNVGTGVVTIATTAGETIDNSSTLVMPTQYTSVDIISDTANWNLT